MRSITADALAGLMPKDVPMSLTLIGWRRAMRLNTRSCSFVRSSLQSAGVSPISSWSRRATASKRSTVAAASTSGAAPTVVPSPWFNVTLIVYPALKNNAA